MAERSEAKSEKRSFSTKKGKIGNNQFFSSLRYAFRQKGIFLTQICSFHVFQPLLIRVNILHENMCGDKRAA